MTLILTFLSAAGLFLILGFSGVLTNATLLVFDTITNVPEYLSRFIVLSSALVPSWIMAIILSILAIAIAFLIVKIFQHLIQAIT